MIFIGLCAVRVAAAESLGNAQEIPVARQAELSYFTTTMADLNNTWRDIFQSRNRVYRPPNVSLYQNHTYSPCGEGYGIDGPFYCPVNQTFYLDLSYLHRLKRRHSSPGEFALAYVIAHEVGHHVQNIWGILARAQTLPTHVRSRATGRISVDIELMADCLAGVWAAQQAGSLSYDTITGGMDAAHVVGGQSTLGRVALKNASHGGTKQRYEWFKRGYTTGQPQSCNIL